MQTQAERGIYVHVPFCGRKCQYCDFHSVVADDTFVGSYFDAFRREVDARASQLGNHTFQTLFIGGGTPSVLRVARLEQLLDLLHRRFSFSADAEITVEVNPSSLSAEKLQCLRSGGVNRLSMGVQSFEPHLLQVLGRLHSVGQVHESFAAARRLGFDNLSVDLMFGLPDQTTAQWQSTLAAAVQLGVEHVSAYSLILEEGTAFYRWAQRGLLALPDEETETAMFATAMHDLPAQGLEQYEISNYAKPGFASRHNILYWTGQPYLALGSGAAGWWQGRRYINTRNMEQYMRCWLERPAEEPLDLEEHPDLDQQMDEYMMTGMRLLAGVHGPTFADRFGRNIQDVYPQQVQTLLERELVQWTQTQHLQLTWTGRFLGNLVFSAWLR